MSRLAGRLAAAASAAMAVASCSGGTSGAGTVTPGRSGSAVTPPSVSLHDLAVALRQVTTQATAELASTSMDLQQASTLDQAAQTLGAHAMTFTALHTTLDQLPAFPVPQVDTDVRRLDADLAALSSTISAALAAEVSQYAQYRRQITAAIATATRDVGIVTGDIQSY
jgi:hypothetical protein